MIDFNQINLDFNKFPDLTKEEINEILEGLSHFTNVFSQISTRQKLVANLTTLIFMRMLQILDAMPAGLVFPDKICQAVTKYPVQKLSVVPEIGTEH